MTPPIIGLFRSFLLESFLFFDTAINGYNSYVRGQAVFGTLHVSPTPWLTERHGYDPTSNSEMNVRIIGFYGWTLEETKHKNDTAING